MCGRITLKNPRRINLFRPDDEIVFSLVPRYNIAPTQDVLVAVEREGQREAAMFQWGLIPYWSKEPKGIINARVETIEEKASFKDSFERRRCLILADGFYEWERNGRVLQPYYFQLQDEAPFALAGIWDRWRTGERTITSCAIITTTANELLAKIHHRMPVIIHPESYNLWLNEDSRTTHLKELLAPFPSAEMTSYAVTRDVNDTKIDDERLLRPVEQDIGANLRLF
jgi:putative SOS response-associated peptidase YedK